MATRAKKVEKKAPVGKARVGRVAGGTAARATGRKAGKPATPAAGKKESKAQRLAREAVKLEQESLCEWVCSWEFEKNARAEGSRIVAGVDEVGRGPLFGPVVAAAVILPHD